MNANQSKQSESSENEWRVVTMRGAYTMSHPVIAIAPGCPDARHPTRDCQCRVFRNRATANAYVSAQ